MSPGSTISPPGKRSICASLSIACIVTAAASPAGAGPVHPGASAKAGVGFELTRTLIKPASPLFDGRKPIRLLYRFRAAQSLELKLRVVDVSSGNTVAAWRERRARPGRRLVRRWDGLNRRGKAADDGRYEFRVGPAGGRDRYGGRFRLRGHAYPVDGTHGDRGAVGQFGAGRNGGRTHAGYDILAGCGTRLVAARGGRVAKVGYDPRLYGWFVRINARKSSEQYFYAHLIAKPEVGSGDRVRTDQPLGKVGQTGNATSTPCHLHFELRERGRLVDPRPALARWDG